MKKDKFEYQSNKEQTLREALGNISQAEKFLLVTVNENLENEPPIKVIAFCDDGLERETLEQGIGGAYYALQLITNTDNSDDPQSKQPL